MPWKPSQPGEVPTLGWAVLDWFPANLAAPDSPDYRPFHLTDEQAAFVLRFYEIDPATGRRVIRRGVISRPRGWGKSPFLAALALAEALGPVVPDGWDADGQPVGKPWSQVRTPIVKLAAVSEMQTQNSWVPLLEMCEGPVIDNYPGLEPLGTFVNLPRGRIEPTTASAQSAKGNKPVFAILDQTEEWTATNGGIRLAETMRINAAKIGGTTVESPNAFVPGLGSVAENSAQYYKSILEGKAREDRGLLYDHREAPPETDMADRESLLAGLRYVYGDSADSAGGWVDLDRIVAEVWDPDIDPQTARADFLNQITHASDAWLAAYEWEARKAADVVVEPGEMITLGFDGSRRRNRGVTDATALIGCRVADGHLFTLGESVWEQPAGPAGADWEVPVAEVDAKVREAMDTYKVVGFFADPAKWESWIAQWEASFGRRMLVKSSAAHPIEWWMTGGRALQIVRITQQLHDAVVDGEMTHSGSSVLTRHMLNARRRQKGTTGVQIAKAHPDSPRKIDAAVAAILAYEARMIALSRGLGRTRRRRAARARGF